MTRSTDLSRELLSQAELHEVHSAILSADLTSSRAILFACIDEAFIAGIPSEATPAGQLLRDLHVMNRVHSLADGTTPFATWLRNAIQLAGSRNEATVFSSALSRLEGRLGPREQLPSDRHHPCSIDELIKTLEDRAQHIRDRLIDLYGHERVRDFLVRFDRLHAEHVKSLRDGFFLRAHELVRQIHGMCFEKRTYQDSAVEYGERLMVRYRRSSPPLRWVIDSQKTFLKTFYVPEFSDGEPGWQVPPSSPTNRAQLPNKGAEGAAYASVLAQVVAAQRRQYDFEWQQQKRLRLALALPPESERARIQEELIERGFRCPHCHEVPLNLRVIDKGSRYYICGLCSRSFDEPER